MRFTCLLSSLVLVSGLCYAQQQQQVQYVETWNAKIKQDRVADFGALATRVADANRRGKGDTFLAYSAFYGPDGDVMMLMPRSSLDEIEPAMGKFLSVAKEYLGFAPDRLMAETARLVEQSHSALRRRRPDLSANMSNQEAWINAISNSRYLYTAEMRVLPGTLQKAEKLLLMAKTAAEGASSKPMRSVTQGMMGNFGVLYVTAPLKSFADLEAMSIRRLLGEAGFEAYQQLAAQSTQSVDVRVWRAVPEWSNPPKSVADANPKMWNVKPAQPAAAKPKTTDAAPKPLARAGG